MQNSLQPYLRRNGVSTTPRCLPQHVVATNGWTQHRVALDAKSVVLNKKIADLGKLKRVPMVRVNSFDSTDPLPLGEILLTERNNADVHDRGNLDYRAGERFLTHEAADTVSTRQGQERKLYKPIMPHTVSNTADRLSPAHKKVMTTLEAYAEKQSKRAYPSLLQRAKRLSYSERTLQMLLNRIYCSDVVIRINPDKHGNGKTVLSSLQQDTHYRNLFEMGFSNGSQNENSRERWESGLFQGAYERHFGKRLRPSDRPKYGTLNVLDLPSGSGGTHYGDLVFVLKPCHGRVTLCYDDSSAKRYSSLGTPRHCAHTLNAMTNSDLSKLLRSALDTKKRLGKVSKILEVQIHGDVLLRRDIAIIRAPNRLWNKHGKVLAELCVKWKSIGEKTNEQYISVMERYYRNQERITP